MMLFHFNARFLDQTEERFMSKPANYSDSYSRWYTVSADEAISYFSFEDAGIPLDFYHLGGNTVKTFIRGREAEGV